MSAVVESGAGEEAKVEPLPESLSHVKTIAIGSGSWLKEGAVKIGFNSESRKISVHPCSDVPSLIPDQPLGVAETRQGARNRACGALLKMPSAQLWIGIESGMMKESEKKAWISQMTKIKKSDESATATSASEVSIEGDPWIDAACIIILVKKKDSPEITIDLEKTRDKSSEMETEISAGLEKSWFEIFEVWSEDLVIPAESVKGCLNEDESIAIRTWSPLKDPHSEISGRSRRIWLAECITGWVLTQ